MQKFDFLWGFSNLWPYLLFTSRFIQATVLFRWHPNLFFSIQNGWKHPMDDKHRIIELVPLSFRKKSLPKKTHIPRFRVSFHFFQLKCSILLLSCGTSSRQRPDGSANCTARFRFWSVVLWIFPHYQSPLGLLHFY